MELHLAWFIHRERFIPAGGARGLPGHIFRHAYRAITSVGFSVCRIEGSAHPWGWLFGLVIGSTAGDFSLVTLPGCWCCTVISCGRGIGTIRAGISFITKISVISCNQNDRSGFWRRRWSPRRWLIIHRGLNVAISSVPEHLLLLRVIDADDVSARNPLWCDQAIHLGLGNDNAAFDRFAECNLDFNLALPTQPRSVSFLPVADFTHVDVGPSGVHRVTTTWHQSAFGDALPVAPLCARWYATFGTSSMGITGTPAKAACLSGRTVGAHMTAAAVAKGPPAFFREISEWPWIALIFTG